MSYSVGVDIGGTFTDFVIVNDETGEINVDKYLTTTDPSDAVFEGLDALISRLEISMRDIRKIVHGTTLVTNTVIERTGAKTGLIATKGFRDILDMRREVRYDLYDLKIKFPPPLIPRYLRKEITERIMPNGKIIKPAREEEIREVVKDLVEKEGVASIAVCLMHSYTNPKHEKVVKKIMEEEFPQIYTSISNEIHPRIGEYERTSTTVVNAYVLPKIERYVDKLESGLAERGFLGEFYIMTCGGGMIKPDVAKDFPVHLLESGPVAGAVVSRYLGEKLGINNVLAFDMGGTTSKGCVIEDNVLFKAYEFEAARYHQFKPGSGIPIMTPNIKLIEIGGGGGSIVSLDERGLIQIGPKSAGANPGPACYGLGGDQPTVTDADLILGYLSPNYFLGGDIPLYLDRAEKAISEIIAKPLGIKTTEAAWGIHEKVNEDVAMAFRLHTAERGIDSRGYVLIPFGGAGPIHACRVARKLKMSKVIFPYRAGVLSSLGLLVTPILFDFTRTHRVNLNDLSFEEYQGIFDQMIKAGVDLLKRAGLPDEQIMITRLLDMRYEGQGYEIEIEIPTREMKAGEIKRLKEMFETRYQELYSLSGLSESIEIVNFKVSASGPVPEVKLVSEQVTPAETALKGSRTVFFADPNDYIDCKVYDRYKLMPGMRIEGPAVVEERESTCVLEPGTTALVDEFLNLVLEITG